MLESSREITEIKLKGIGRHLSAFVGTNTTTMAL
jgi:hypothetical protein